MTQEFLDLVYPDNPPAIDVRAQVTLLPEAERPRGNGERHGWRPNHNFGDPGNRQFYIGLVSLGNAAGIAPGETLEASIRFIDGPGLREQLVPGRIWRIQEGARLIASGTVLEVLGEA